mmetsp:Transcript_3997/g.8803  ORF Transcript_3997/g.8803 Transcript_3997/m.8803 type:complete len:283 (+) Transcript_3997:666-1514(+)
MARIARGHHVVCIKHLLRELVHVGRNVLLASHRRQRRVPDHEEMQPRERNQVDRELAQVGVELAWEPQRARDARHHARHELVEVRVAGVRQLERVGADVVQRLVVNGKYGVRVLHELVHRQRRVVWLHHRVAHLGGRHHRVRAHHPIRKLLTNLGNQQSSHSRAGPASERVRDLEPLQAVTVFRLTPNHVHHGVHQFRAFRVVPLCPVVSRARLSKHGVVRSVQRAEFGAADRIHNARLEIHKHSSRHVPSALRLVVVHIDALQLTITIGAFIHTRRVDPVL